MSLKTIKDLEDNAYLYWPDHLSEEISTISPLPILLKTQDQFISILIASDKDPQAWLYTLEKSSSLSPGIFLKHLMILTDIGGERLQRISKDFSRIFPNNSMEFVWDSHIVRYDFSESRGSWNNKSLNVEKSVLMKGNDINSDMKDVVMLLLWGSSVVNNSSVPQEIIEKCVVGSLLGKPEELKDFIKQRYIMVSKITGGSTANDLGHACENYVVNFLKKNLPSGYVVSGHTIHGISHNEKNLTTFDCVVKGINGIYFAIEISFQVTTNSVIERKAGLAQSRKDLLNSNGHKVIYIIDGSGNFQRRNAIQTILNFSDLVVNFSKEDLDKLVDFIIQHGDE